MIPNNKCQCYKKAGELPLKRNINIKEIKMNAC